MLKMLASTYEEVINHLLKLNLQFDINQKPPFISSFVPPAPQANGNGYNMSYQALDNTLRYTIDKLKLKFKLLIICNGKYFNHIDVIPKTSPEEYLKYLKQLNPKLKWPKTFTYKNQKFYVDKKVYTKKNLRFMNCIISEVNDVKEDEDLFYIKRLKAVGDRYDLPDGIYVLAPTDDLILRNDGKEPWVDVVGGEKKLFSHNYSKYIPILNGNSGLKYLDIPLPNYEDLQFLWNKEMQEQMKLHYSWEQKIDKAVFRGSATGCGFTYNRNMRLKAVLISKKFPQYLNAGISAMKEKLKIDEKDRVGYTDLNKLGIKFNKLSPYEQSRYKYILHLDGNVGAHRLAKFFLLNSTTLICETGSTLWFSHILIPYTHYVPVKKDLSDLIEKIKWCRENDDKCRDIARNAFELGKKLLTEEVCFSYIAKTMWASRGV